MDEQNITRHEFSAVVERLDAENERQNHRIDVLERLTENVKELAVNMKLMVTEQKTQSERIGKLENRDGERWRVATRTALVAFITAVITAAVTVTLSKLGIL